MMMMMNGGGGGEQQGMGGDGGDGNERHSSGGSHEHGGDGYSQQDDAGEGSATMTTAETPRSTAMDVEEEQDEADEEQQTTTTGASSSRMSTLRFRMRRNRNNDSTSSSGSTTRRKRRTQVLGGRTEEEANQDILYLPWCRPPFARQQGFDYENYARRPVISSYLVLDLTVARALANLGNAYDKPEADIGRIDVFILLFLPIFWQWLKTSHITNRFDVEDFVSTILFAVNMVLMSYVGVNIGTCATRFFEDADRCPQYTGSLTGLRAVHLFHLLYAFHFNRRFKRFFYRQIFIESLVLLLWAITSMLNDATETMWWVTISFELIAFVVPHFFPPQFALKPEERVPLHPDLLASRHRRFASMALAFVAGRAIVNLNDAETFFTSQEAFRIVLTVLIVVGLKLQYFDLVDVDRPTASSAYASRHPLVRTQEHDRYRVAWEVSHFFLNVGTVLVGSTLSDFVGSNSSLRRYWLCRPLACASLVTVFQQVLSSGGLGGYRKRRFRKQSRILFRLVGILVTFIIPDVITVKSVQDNTFAALVVLWFVFTVVFDLWARMPSKDKIAFNNTATSEQSTLQTQLLEQP
ncbi:hypothetical protein PTSG_07491 [Salpingoeca rosetta]|uniref:Uncharacterized protein n=1 Tax=Salpingoeca rosetta (strain ATCC 50818 / BSB-021) TaxID=946362 RepID=F2UIV9_SALR5|nr:uncharacterized protein PTSG_07491 [Salpingoeca rosetta]EGD77158.1 hypothetical protein PTSG_07491 [Salpingoeca rosetta]|eukprot:XP_004990997.1 hypothetical protein PTSG_07491 [Salpingoeca rosetta]